MASLVGWDFRRAAWVCSIKTEALSCSSLGSYVGTVILDDGDLD